MYEYNLCFVANPLTRFSQVHDFEQPNDEEALNLMNARANAVLKEYPDMFSRMVFVMTTGLLSHYYDLTLILMLYYLDFVKNSYNCCLCLLFQFSFLGQKPTFIKGGPGKL